MNQRQDSTDATSCLTTGELWEVKQHIHWKSEVKVNENQQLNHTTRVVNLGTTLYHESVWT